MIRKRESLYTLLILLFMTAGLVALWGLPQSHAQAGGLFDSPLPTPTPAGQGIDPTKSPTPTPTPPSSEEAQQALQYVSEHYNVPLAELLVVYEGEEGGFSYPLLGRRFTVFGILDRANDRIFKLLVDLADGRVEELTAIEQAEAETHRVKYDKLHPALYERLQSATDEEVLPVAIWVGGERGRDDEALYAILASRYPEVQQALNRHASPFDLDDPALAQKVRTEYEQMRQEDITARVQPLVTALESQGAVVETHFLLPSVTTALSKAAILALAGRDDVAMIYLIEGEEEPALDTGVPTNRAAPLWAAGIDGSQGTGSNGQEPIGIAIVENGNVDWDNSFLNQFDFRLAAAAGETDHATRVASAAASFHDTYRGMAYGAKILSAGTDGSQSRMHFSVNWALDQGANGVSISGLFYTNTSDLDWIDRALDYTARVRGATIMVAAGNFRNQYIAAPAKGWNMISVGGLNDQGTSDWGDDVMYQVTGTNEGSSYLDPGPPGDREKPEIAAPGQNIRAIGINDQPRTGSGTSHAAPQTTGLAALLMHRNPDVQAYPTAIKAILMASAAHNIEGNSRLSEEDGAGSIDAVLADGIVQTHQADGVTCTELCWWAINTTNTYPAPSGWLYQYFNASRGERIRVAIAWWSLADPPPSYPTLGDDDLATDFDLRVESLSSSDQWSSISVKNNYEIVEFVAPVSGLYRIGVLKFSATENTNQLGIAWTKQATYLPQVMANVHGWQSRIFVRNDGATATTPTIIFYDTAGNDYGPFTSPDPIDPNEVWTLLLDSGLFEGSGIVSGSEDLSVTVENYRSSYGQSYSYSGLVAANSLNSGWGQIGTPIHLPLLMDNNSGWSTEVTVFNPNQVTATFNFDCFGQGTGGGPWSVASQVPLGPHQSIAYNQAGSPCATIGAGRITSDQPLAVTVLQEASGVSMGYTGFSAGATTVNLPLIMANNSGWGTGIAVQNLGAANTTVQVQYYPLPGYPSRNPESLTVAPNRTGIFQQAGGQWGTTPWIGSARVTAGQEIAAIVNQNVTGRGMNYNSFLNGSRLIVLPDVRNNASGWTSGMQVQNIDSSTANVVLRVNGSQTWAGSIASYRSITLLPVPGTGSGFQGEATVESTNGRRIVAIVNQTQNSSSDRAMSYNGVNR